ncbi:MAG: AAA family ATPase, partial [Myxococcales bacterium]|nr:AAA family ATPase [Myxococcales bacterium]
DVLCKDYAEAKSLKASKEKEKEDARAALKEHRDRVFGTYQASINTFLVKFNADFRVEKLSPSDARGVPSSSYEFVVNKEHVGTAKPDDPEPSFATVLSSGDRNTLALAFFFATLQERSSLDDAIVVIDDPASSLDDGRAFATVQEIRALVGRADQVVVLAHARPILCQLWERADKDTTATIEIRNETGVADASTLVAWDAEAASVTEYDRLHSEVRGYAESSTGEAQRIAVTLRPVLECFLRVAYVEEFPPGRSLGDFLGIAKQRAQDGPAIMSEADIGELDNLREYANQFHHNTSKNWQENLSNVNETQLKGYANRVVGFTRIGRPAP